MALDTKGRSVTLKDITSAMAAIAALIAAVAAFRGSHEAGEYVAFLKASKGNVITADNHWRVSKTHVGGWKERTFDDSRWEFSIAPAPDRADLATEETSYRTMWVPGGSQPRTTAYFRRIVPMPDRDRLERVTMISAADDDHRIYVNGTAVVSDSDLSAGPVVFSDITQFIRTGDNIFAVAAMNDSGGSWLSLDIQVQRK